MVPGIGLGPVRYLLNFTFKKVRYRTSIERTIPTGTHFLDISVSSSSLIQSLSMSLILF
ncbi:hypothetical protein HanRHA438_Chr17g0812431 [Helianthus annuus]|nr:hypothetical protein HanRHA438_Chr17g0812431 [Helianthus annuus]